MLKANIELCKSKICKIWKTFCFSWVELDPVLTIWHNDTKMKNIYSSPMVQQTGVQSQVKSYQRLKKWYLIPPCLTLSIIRYMLRVKWSNPGKGEAPSTTSRCCSYWKGSLWVTIDYSHQLYFYFISLKVTLAKWIEWSPVVRETVVQSQLESYQRLKKWYMILFTNPSARAGYDTRSVFKRSLTGLNSEFSFS